MYVEVRPVKTMPRDSQTEHSLFKFGIYTIASAADFTLRPMIFNPDPSATQNPGPKSSSSLHESLIRAPTATIRLELHQKGTTSTALIINTSTRVQAEILYKNRLIFGKEAR